MQMCFCFLFKCTSSIENLVIYIPQFMASLLICACKVSVLINLIPLSFLNHTSISPGMYSFIPGFHANVFNMYSILGCGYFLSNIVLVHLGC